MTKAEAAQYNSPEEAGRRVVESLRAWLARAIKDLGPETLPPEVRDWYRLDPEPAIWFDPRHPHLSLGECHRLVSGIPPYRPGWIEWTPKQARALKVLHDARAAVDATKGVPAPAALPILECAINLGDGLAQAHVAPWEPIAALGQNYSRQQSEKGHEGARKRWDGAHKAVGTIVERLARECDGWGDPAPPSELWPRLFAALENAGLRPEDRGDRYDCDGYTITRDNFRQKLSRLRRA